MTMLSAVCLACALLPLALGATNLLLFRAPGPAGKPAGALSVLIPARNEERNIEAAVRAVLASHDTALEILVLDDGSTDATSDILARIADDRLRVLRGGALPAGWCGKQHACFALARQARHETLVFLDADVRLAPDALARMVGFLDRSGAALVSGFPRQIACTWSEKLLLPLIHFLLLGFLPMFRMRSSLAPAYAAGCGQVMVARRDAYFAAGGHAAIRASLHDGLTLPRAFRRAGFRTDLFDATPFASCRMYDGAAALWEGLGKNATEGMATWRALPVWTALLGLGQVVPWLMLWPPSYGAASAAALAALAFRLILALRFRQSVVSALFHPAGVALMLIRQWSALLRAARGKPSIWRGRAYQVSP